MPALLAPLDEARENLRVIRQTMERSTKYSTLSGLSGVLIGLAAILGVWVSHVMLSQAGHLPVKADYLKLGPLWLAVLALAVTIEFACNKRRAARIGKRVDSPLGGAYSGGGPARILCGRAADPVFSISTTWPRSCGRSGCSATGWRSARWVCFLFGLCLI